MENKNVGYLIIGISAVIIVIILLFSSAMRDIVGTTCNANHGDSCPMYKSIDRQTYLAFAIVGVLIVVALMLIFSKPNEIIIVKKVKERKAKRNIDTSDLKKEEKEIFKLLQQDRTVFQAVLIERTGFGKAKMTRIIDRLEGKGLVERRRRGMTNVVVLKED